jgi:pyruvate-formate lyase-activating enzyme
MVVILDLVKRLGAVAEGDTVTVPLRSPEDLAAARDWCARSGNTLVRGDGAEVVVRRGRSQDPVLELAAARRPGTRLWIYTNFDCNLACDYCCVRSSPHAERRALGPDRIRRLVAEAADAGVMELLLTGGEPFLLPALGEIVAACAARLPTTLLTNGMLFRGRRLETLRAMNRNRLRLQISLDSATPDRHDAHRGHGTWARALAGIRLALAEGFTVRVAATLVSPDPEEERELRGFLTGLGVAAEDQILRPLAQRGMADTGLVLTVESLVPEVTVTADGVYWHPVGADDADQLVTTRLFPLAPAIAEIQQRFREQLRTADARARAFPCA